MTAGEGRQRGRLGRGGKEDGRRGVAGGGFFYGRDPLTSYPRMRAAGVIIPYLCNFIKFLKTTTYGLNDRVSLF